MISAGSPPPKTTELDHQWSGAENDLSRSLLLKGSLNRSTLSHEWKELTAEINTNDKMTSLTINLSQLEEMDGSAIGFLVEIQKICTNRGIKLTFEGLSTQQKSILDLYDPCSYVHRGTPESHKCQSLPVEVGSATLKQLSCMKEEITFIGEMILALLAAIRNPKIVRWGDTFRMAEIAGVNALPVVILVGFLIGFVMAFQAAIPLKMFGAEILIAGAVGIAMVRELGPIMTAVALAGRSSTAFAAEIGTMKVNEEVNALVTFGLDPVRFLVLPRLIAAIAMTPFLAVFGTAAGILGGYIVYLSLGFPTTIFIDQLRQFIGVGDVLGALVKTLVFGIVIAGVGCLRGLQTQTGASAVGESTTRAVVSSIILVTLLDGIFSILYYALGI